VHGAEKGSQARATGPLQTIDRMEPPADGRARAGAEQRPRGHGVVAAPPLRCARETRRSVALPQHAVQRENEPGPALVVERTSEQERAGPTAARDRKGEPGER
jgi:hypothetical protein